MQRNRKEDALVEDFSVSRNETLVTFHDLPPGQGVVGDILSTLAAVGIGVDLISETSREDGRISLSFTMPTPSLDKGLGALSTHGKPLHDSLVLKLTIEGRNLRTNPAIAAEFFRVLGKNRVHPLMISTSENRISTLVNNSDFNPQLEEQIIKTLGL